MNKALGSDMLDNVLEQEIILKNNLSNLPYDSGFIRVTLAKNSSILAWFCHSLTLKQLKFGKKKRSFCMILVQLSFFSKKLLFTFFNYAIFVNAAITKNEKT